MLIKRTQPRRIDPQPTVPARWDGVEEGTLWFEELYNDEPTENYFELDCGVPGFVTDARQARQSGIDDAGNAYATGEWICTIQPIEHPPVWQYCRCEICHGSFTEDEWEIRHGGPNGEDWHDYCCPICEAEESHEEEEE